MLFSDFTLREEGGCLNGRDGATENSGDPGIVREREGYGYVGLGCAAHRRGGREPGEEGSGEVACYLGQSVGRCDDRSVDCAQHVESGCWEKTVLSEIGSFENGEMVRSEGGETHRE